MTNKHRRRKMPFLMFLITLFVVFPMGVSAATLHAILAVDTNDNRIGTSVKIDLVIMQNLVNKISRYTGLTTAGSAISGNELNWHSIMEAVEKLSVGSDDVVLFYYAGHGYNPGNSAWPAMSLKGNNLPLKTVREALKAKKPRLLIVMADTCNGTGNRGGFNAREAGKAENYKVLFLKYRGTITASSSEPGEFSYSNAQIGGFYTNAFFNSLIKELDSNQTPSWEAIMKRANAPLSHGSQHPQAKVDVELIREAIVNNTDGCSRRNPQGCVGGVSAAPINTGTCQKRYRRGGKKCCLDWQGKEHCWSLTLD